MTTYKISTLIANRKDDITCLDFVTCNYMVCMYYSIYVYKSSVYACLAMQLDTCQCPYILNTTCVVFAII